MLATKKLFRTVLTLLSLCFITQLSAQTRWYVDTATVASQTGHSWNTALNDLQAALDSAGTGDTILVSKGIYHPDRGTGSRDSSFVMKPNVVLLGGFSVEDNAININDRHPFSYHTVLSGEIQQDGDSTNNTYIIINNDNNALNQNAVLDGFVISGGYNDRSLNPLRGAGMYNAGISVTVRNCTFTGNTIVAPTSTTNLIAGAGMCNYNATAFVSDCIFTHNRVIANNSNLGQARGGALYNHGTLSNSTFTRCSFLYNESQANHRAQGGAVYNDQASKPRYYNCTFSYNNCAASPSTYGWTNGAAMFNGSSVNVQIYNCLFSHNSTETARITEFANGGAVCNLNAQQVEVANCTFADNVANAPVGGTARGGAIWNYAGILNITNSILYGNMAHGSPSNLYFDNGTSSIEYSNIGGCGGSGAWKPNCGNDDGNNIDTDPLYIDQGSQNYETDTCAPGYNAGVTGGIPSGLPSTDLNGNARTQGGAIDMGAYEMPLSMSCPYSWNGSVSNEWATAANWDGGNIPPSYATIIIPDVANDPVLDTARQLGSLSVDSGATLYLNKQRLYMHGNLHNSGTVNCDSSAIEFASEVEQTIEGDIVIDTMVINAPGGVEIISGNTGVKKELQLKAGVLSCSANLTLLSDSNGTARIPAIEDGSISGNVNYELFIDGSIQNWRQLTSPVQGAQLADWNDDLITTGFPGSDFPALNWINLYSYNETISGDFSNGYEVPSGINDNIDMGEGYMIYTGGGSDTIVDVTGPIYSGTLNLPLDYTSTGSATDDGWNMAGNPMPSPVDISSLAVSGTANSFYFYDPVSGNYAAWHDSISTGTLGADGNIAIGQAFWIQATSPSASLTFTELSKTSSAKSFLNKNARPPMRISLFNNNQKLDDAVLRTAEACDHTYGRHDSRKLYNSDTTLLAIATTSADQEKLSINSLGELTTNTIVPLLINGKAGDLITLTFEHTAMFNEKSCLLLENTLTNQLTLLNRDSSLQFTLPANGRNDFLQLRITAAPSVELVVNGIDRTPEKELTICSGDEISLTAHGAASGSLLSWNAGIGNGLPFTPDTGSKTYVVTESHLTNGCIVSSEVNLTVSPLPSPSITQKGEQLTTEQYETYQWYLNEQPIAGATAQEYTFQQPGLYQVEAGNKYDCKGISEVFDLATGTQQVPVTMGGIVLYPNPGKNELNIEMILQMNSRVNIEINDLSGRKVLHESSIHISGGKLIKKYDLSLLRSGIYFVYITSDEEKQIFKWVKH